MSLGRALSRTVAWWHARRRRLLELWAIGIIASLAVTAASALGYLDDAQTRSLDLLLRLRETPRVDDVRIVAIDAAAFEALHQRQPISRAYLARIVRGLARAGTRVIALDVSLSTPTAEDAALAAAVRDVADGNVSRVVTVTGLPPTGPLAEIAALTVNGIPVVAEDAGVIRRAPLALHRDGAIVPTFALAVLAGFADMDAAALKAGLEAPAHTVSLPVWRQGARPQDARAPLAIEPDVTKRINFVGPARTFLTVPSGAVVHLADPGAVAPMDNPFRGRIVLVGGTFPDSRDFYATPHGQLPGVEIHANLVHMIGTRTFVEPAGWLLGLALQLAFVGATAVLLVLLNPVVGTVVTLAGGFVVGVPASYLVFARGHHWVDFMLPIFTMRVMGWGVDLLDRRLVREVLERYVPQRKPIGGGGTSDRVDVTLLAVAAPGIIAAAEKRSPGDVVGRLLAYRAVAETAITQHGGRAHAGVDDTILGVFRGDDATLRAVRAARALVAAVGDVDRIWLSDGMPSLRLRTIVHTGSVVVREAGGDDLRPVAVVGPPADIGIRLARLTVEPAGAILVTDAARAALGAAVAVGEPTRVCLPGEAEEVVLSELIEISMSEAPGA